MEARKRTRSPLVPVKREEAADEGEEELDADEDVQREPRWRAAVHAAADDDDAAPDASYVVWLTDDCRPAVAAKARELLQRAGATFTSRWEAGVTHVVTSERWLTAVRGAGVEQLFALTAASHLRAAVAPDWILASHEVGRLLPPSRFRVPWPPMYVKAAERRTPLLCGFRLVFSGRFEGASVQPAQSTKVRSESRASQGGNRLAADKLDLVLLALLHGAEVVDVLGRTPLVLGIDGHRGCTYAELVARQPVPATPRTTRVVVASADSLSRLGLEIYASRNMRPLLAQWLVHCINAGDVDTSDRFVVFGVTK